MASNPIAALIVKVLTDHAELITGVKTVTKELDGLSSTVGAIGKTLAGAFTAGAITAFANDILNDIDAIDVGARKLATSREEFQRISFAVRQTGGDMEKTSAAVVLLTDKLASGDAGLYSALRKLNISIEEFKAKDPSDRFISLASAINGVTDPTRQLELRLEALGPKGVEALASIDAEFEKLAKNAPVYSQETINALKEAGDAYDAFWASVKTGSAEAFVALKNFLDLSKTQVLDENGAPKYYSGSGDVKDNPIPRPGSYGDDGKFKPSSNSPASLGFGGVDPNNEKEMATALADLALKYQQLQDAEKEELDTRKASVFVWQTLKMEVKDLADAMGPFLKAFETSTAVENFSQRIIDAAVRVAALRRETDAITGRISGANPVSEDPIDALNRDAQKKIDELRKDSRNWGKDGNLTAQALDEEDAILDNVNMKVLALKMGFDDVTKSATDHLGIINQVGDAYNKLRAPQANDLDVQARRDDISKAAAEHRYFGPVTQNGLPDFEKLGLGNTTNNITNNFTFGPLDDPRNMDRIARSIDDMLARRARSQSRT